MSNPILGQQLGPQLIALLGLPKNVKWFELRCASNEVVSVKCEYFPDAPASFETVLAEYEMVARTDVVSAMANMGSALRDAYDDLRLHPATVMGFDAWMRQRIDHAHEDMMAASGRLLSCESYWATHRRMVANLATYRDDR